MWACCYTNKNVNYGVRTTQQSEATNAHLKRLLGHTAPLPELINAIEKLSRHQLQCYQYQQYRLCNSIRQQGPELLKDVSLAVSDFVYTLLLEQHNMALTYDIKRQEANLLHVYHNEIHKYTIYQIDNRYICSCDYNVQFALPCRHVLAVHIANKEILSLNYIGTRWVIFFSELTMTEKQNDIMSTRSTSDLLKDIETISNRVGHVEINNTLALFVEQLNSKYPLLQEDIRDPVIAKTKGRPSGTKCKKTGSEHVTKKKYVCSICNSTGHNSRSCLDK
ncbi:599_t:CDS:2, partial [Cetraspora pellucida]